MNDAEFCSDGHRQSYGEEQLLAMQRLTETAPPAPRAPRMPGGSRVVYPVPASEPQVAPVDAAPPIAARATIAGPTMTVIGNLVLDTPMAMPAMGVVVSAAPLMAAAIVLFRDREHRFQAGFAQSTVVYPVATPLVSAQTARATTFGQASALRVAMPRGLASRLHRTGRWAYRVVEERETISPPVAADFRASGLTGVAEKVEPTSYSLTAVTMDRPIQRRPRQLGRATGVLALTLGCAGKKARPWGSLQDSNAPRHVTAGQISYPRNPVQALSFASAYPVETVNEELWALVAATPLGALQAATSYPTVALARSSAAPARMEPASVEFPNGRYAVPEGVREIGAGDLRSLQQMLAVHAPGARNTSKARGSELEILPLAPSRRVPVRRGTEQRRALPFVKMVMAVASPTAAQSAITNHRDDELAAPLAGCTLPAPSVRTAAVRLSAARLTGVPAPPAAGAAKAGLLDDPEVSEVFAAKVGELVPSTGVPAAGQNLLIASPVPFDWRPAAAVGRLSVYQPRTLVTVLRLRLPLHSSFRSLGYASADCVPVPSPNAVPLPWTRLVENGSDLTPATVLPGAISAQRPFSLRTLPVRLYKVPGAQPMAQPCAKRPKVFPMGEWGGRPAICPSLLVADDGRPRSSFESTERLGRELLERFSSAGLQRMWGKASHLPSDLKWIAMVVPLIIGIWVLARPSTAETSNPPVSVRTEDAKMHPDDPALPVAKDSQLAAVRPLSTPPMEVERNPLPEKARIEPVSTGGGNSAWDSFTAHIANRASINFVEDFHNGLSLWDGRGEWARSWSYDRSGIVRPGRMAIFQPSVGLRDYVFEMKASIERRSIQWMVRAADAQNYHFARLNVTPGAPLTKLELERWTVINGRVGRVTRLPLPHGGANQTLYAIRVEVRGDSITTYLQDQVIDTFNDSRLQTGGVGLVGGADDRPRVYGIHVTHQNDFLGKLCSFLAPPPIVTQGSD